MYNLTAADFADTGQWRLLLNIGCTTLDAYLENTLHPEIPLQHLCSATWDLNKDLLQKNIEDAVYNNPRLLDDFAARIILFDPRTLFIPTSIAEEYPGAEEDLYQKVYVAEETDIMSDRDGDISAAWSLAPGIKGFLMRTFPGARITCNLLEKVRTLRKSNSGLSLFAFARKGETDIILLDDKNLISASTHEWAHPDDIAFLLVNVLDVYDKKLPQTSIRVRDIDTQSEAWKFIEKNACSFITESQNEDN